MDKNLSVAFRITIRSTENSTWQGVVEYNGECREFESELQLLRHVVELIPALSPERRW